MKVSVETIPALQEIEVIIRCGEENDAVRNIVARINAIDRKLSGNKDGGTFLLDLDNILYIETVDRKTFLYTDRQVYESDKRLYELEGQLIRYSFFRVSKAVIINLNRVVSLRPELGARLLLTMDNGEKIIASRMYAGNIKNALGVK